MCLQIGGLCAGGSGKEGGVGKRDLYSGSYDIYLQSHLPEGVGVAVDDDSDSATVVTHPYFPDCTQNAQQSTDFLNDSTVTHHAAHSSWVETRKREEYRIDFPGSRGCLIDTDSYRYHNYCVWDLWTRECLDLRNMERHHEFQEVLSYG